MLIGIFYSQIDESSSLVSVLFREAISHPYISFFHLLVNGFSVIIIIIGLCLEITFMENSITLYFVYIYLYHGCCGNSHGIKLIYPMIYSLSNFFVISMV